MLRASHYIFRDILYTLKCSDFRELEGLCRKYSERYRDDPELMDVCDGIISCIREDVPLDCIDVIGKRLEDLIQIRRITTSGGTRLWYANRRGLRWSGISRWKEKESPKNVKLGSSLLEVGSSAKERKRASRRFGTPSVSLIA